MNAFQKSAGPVRGYHVAAYACPSQERTGTFIGYFKVFVGRPESYFDGNPTCMVKGCWDVEVDSPLLAVEQALNQGLQQVLNLPRAREVSAVRERRRPFCWERSALGLVR